LPGVADVRVCGAIGVIECDRPVDLATATPAALDRGVWLRPFRNLVYAMPPFICTPAEIAQVTSTMVEVARLNGSRRI
jgi:adenosylmethionine---8-amino-7-oxononanoate aminotransferase